MQIRETVEGEKKKKKEAAANTAPRSLGRGSHGYCSPTLQSLMNDVTMKTNSAKFLINCNGAILVKGDTT